MPELNVIHIAIIAAMTVAGAVIGWFLRSRRSKEEKTAVSALWQEQINAQRTEHDRLTGQNKGLMEQINQYQASNKDAKNRAKELSEAVQEAYARRDQLQREIKDIRGNLEVAVDERDQLQSDINANDDANDDASATLRAKDERIKKLQGELMNWQNRLPPLIEKFQQRNEDAQRLESELEIAREQIAELQVAPETEQTRIEPVSDPESLTNGRDASNDASKDPEDNVPDVPEPETEWEPEPEPEPEPQPESEPQPDEAAEVEMASDDVSAEADDTSAEHNHADEAATPINAPRDGLQAIKGVGPAIEKTLNEMGIFNFQQIADMSEYDIDRVAKRLKGFRSRIYREDWIGQARELRDQATGD